MPILDITVEDWQHRVRNSMRMLLWQQAETRRKDMQGIGRGIDKSMTLSLMQGRTLNDYDRGILRSVLAGAVWTQQRLHKAKLTTSSVCQFCTSCHEEDQVHLFWECPAWQAIRSKHTCAAFAFRQCWPSCFQMCGLMPESPEAFTQIGMEVEQEEQEADECSDEDTMTEMLAERTQELWNGPFVV
eukprot:11884513-Karenia_brevis.AAC.1